MNREVLKSMGTFHIPVQRLTALLDTFSLKHASRMLPDLLETADTQDTSLREFLLVVLETEVKGRNERRRKRNYSAAHFPPNIRPLEEFDPEELEMVKHFCNTNKEKNLAVGFINICTFFNPVVLILHMSRFLKIIIIMIHVMPPVR